MGGSPDAAGPSALLASLHDHHTQHTRPWPRRDRRHRCRPGRPLDRLPPPAARPLLRHPRRRRPPRRPVAPAVGHPAALLPRRLRRAARHAVPRRPVVLPRQGGGGDVHRAVRRAPPPPRPAGRARRVARGRGCRWLRAAHQPRHLDLRQRRRRDRDLRAGARDPRLRRGARPADRAAALERVPPPRAAPRGPCARRGRVALRHRHRLRRRTDAPDHAVRPRLRRDPGRLRLLDRAPGLPGRSCSPGGTSSRGVRRWAARRCPTSASTAGR